MLRVTAFTDPKGKRHISAVIIKDWTPARIGAALMKPRPPRADSQMVGQWFPPICQSDEVVQHLFVHEKPVRLAKPRPIEPSPHLDALVRLCSLDLGTLPLNR